jgi:hypothetical protein
LRQATAGATKRQKKRVYGLTSFFVRESTGNAGQHQGALMLRKYITACLMSALCLGAWGCEMVGDIEEEDGDFSVYAAVVGTYQAEDYSFQSGCGKATAHAGYTGSGFVDFGGNGTLLEWNNIHAPDAGQYTLVFRYGNGSGGNRQCAITINDTTNAGNVTFGKTGAWTTWATASVKVTLKQGNNKIRLTANTSSGGPNLDKMDLTSEEESGTGGQCALVNEGNTAALSCPSGQVIGTIAFASYGTPTGVCPSFSTSSCHASISKSKVESLCLNKQSCSVGANNGVFGDPCSGTSKKLAVSFTCKSIAPAGQCAQANEGSSASLSCPSGQIINSIALASYGTVTGTCPDFVKGTCHSSNSQAKVESLCLNKGSCSVPANNAVFGDPCSGKPKKLAVLFTCATGNSNSNGTIDAVFFAQTHVQEPTNPYFNLVANRKTLIKAHIIGRGNPTAPVVRAILTLNGKTLAVPLSGPATLPASIPKAPGVVEHSTANTFVGFIPADWMKQGLSVSVEAGSAQVTFDNLPMGPPTKIVMNMFDVQYFQDTTSDYPSGWKDELEAKWPVSSLEVRRVPHLVFKELVVPARKDVGAPAVRVSSKDDYKAQTGVNFDGEQAAALAWNGALKAAAGTSGRHTLYYINIYGVWAGGQAGGFGGVGNGTSPGILCHELGHALSLGDCYGGGANYPYKGDMYGITAPTEGYGIHVGPTWAYYLYKQAFIPPTVQPNAVGGPLGTYKRDPMCGGGQGDQEKGYLMRHYSDYSVLQMRNYLEKHVVVWNSSLNSYASWDSSTASYSNKVTNNGVQYPITRNASVISVMAAVSAVSPNVNMVYPAIGPYTTGLIKLFDPRDATQRQEAGSIYCPSAGCDVTLRVTQGGVQKYYMLAASWDTTVDPMLSGSVQTKAVNLPASAGEVTKVDLLLTPDAQKNGLPSNPTILHSWVK